MENVIVSKLPQTGRIGRFVKILQNAVDEVNLEAIIDNIDGYDDLSNKEKSQWWKNVIKKMEGRIGTEQAIHIMTCCGAKCCGKGQRETARRLMKEAGSIKGFLEKISKHDVKEGDLEYALENENTIIAEHNKCFCKQVASVIEPFDNLIYCQCSVEFNKQFFTAALERSVQVELLQSIISGSKSCKFRIVI
ncbi:MAG: DUF6144 family protein [Anaerolineaceae bacterium]